MVEIARRPLDPEPTGDGVLTAMSGPTRERLVATARRARYEAGSRILVEGADTPFLGLLERGRVALRLRVPERGEPITFVTIEPGELLGWSALVAPYRSTADAVATQDVEILAFEAGELRALLGRDPEVAAALLPILLETVSGRLTTSWHQLIDVFHARTYGPW